MKRLLAWFMILAMTAGTGWMRSTTAESSRKAILERAAELDVEKGSLRSVLVHVYNGEAQAMPTAEDTPESAWLKTLANGLEARWDIAGGEDGDLSLKENQEQYAQGAAAEMVVLQGYREISFTDPLLDMLVHAYIDCVQAQIDLAAEQTKDPIAYAWAWTRIRQDGLKSLYFLNRYYNVSIRKAYKDRMNSYLYEAALTVSENTIGEIWDAQNPTESTTGKDGEENAASATATDEGNPEAEGTMDPSEAYSSETWHADPTGAYELRIHDYDAETMTMMIDLRATADNTLASKAKIDLSQWKKYKEGRFSVGTFYQADGIELVEGGKISFVLHMNVLVDGRLNREVKGKISLKLPTAKKAGGSTGVQTATSATEASALDEEAHEFAEPRIEQDFTGLKAWDIIRMGYYEQDGNTDNRREPIEWQVISVNKKKHVALVVAKYAIETMTYGTEGDESEYLKPGVNWKTSHIREWLNGEFYEKHFTKKEKKRIREASNVTDDKSGRFTTKDHVFLLSINEAKRYMGSTERMSCEATAYVKSKLGSGSGVIQEDGYCSWWMREMVNAAKVNKKGELIKGSCNEAAYIYGSRGMSAVIRKTGGKVFEKDAALVRPAMWIEYDK